MSESSEARSHRTVTLQFTQAILQEAERQGISFPPEVKRDLPGDGRASLALQDRLWAFFCQQTADPLAGLRLGLSLQVGHLDMVGMLLMSCETQQEALELLVEYHPIVGEGGDFMLDRQGDLCRLIYQPHYRVCRRERVEAVLAAVINLARWITGGRFQISGVAFQSEPGAALEHYRDLLDTEVTFGAADNAVIFDPLLLQAPLVQANSTLRNYLKTLADDVLAGLSAGSFSQRIQQLLREQPALGKEQIAQAMGMSGRHLVRKLQSEGVNFRLLRSSVLQQLAEQQLRAGASVADVAELLGFSEHGAFIKAFKRWAGVSPAQFRDSA